MLLEFAPLSSSILNNLKLENIANFSIKAVLKMPNRFK